MRLPANAERWRRLEAEALTVAAEAYDKLAVLADAKLAPTLPE